MLRLGVGAVLALVALGCEQEASGGAGPVRLADPPRAVSAPLGPERQTFLTLERFGRLSARCSRGHTVGVAYRNASGTSQVVAAQDGGQATSGTLNPGDRLLRPGPLVGVQLWQVAAISKGRVELVLVTVSAGRLGPRACFVSARADGTTRAR